MKCSGQTFIFLPGSNVVGRHQEVYQTLNHEGGGSLAGVDPGHDEDHLDPLPLGLLLVLVLQAHGDGLLLVGQVVWGGDRDKVNPFIEYTFAQGLLDNIVVLLTEKFLHTKL